MYAPGTGVEAHVHDALEQVTYVTSGTAEIGVGEEHQMLSKDEAVYIPAHAVHGLENRGNDPVAVLNAYYASSHLWKGSIETFLTELDPRTENSQLRYPSEI